MKTNLRKLLLIPSLFVLASCSNSPARGGYVKDGGYPADYGGDPKGEDVDDYDPTKDEGDENGKPKRAGLLTCSALDDNKEYDFWKEINSDNSNDSPLKEFHKSVGKDFNTFNRVKLTVNNANDVSVTLKDDDTTFYVDNTHIAYLFPSDNKEEYDVTISYLDKDGVRQSRDTKVKNNDEIDLENNFTLSDKLEVMFVIDTTGSMDDELRYIQKEIYDVIAKVQTENANADINLAMMVYRDIGDEYVTKYSDWQKDVKVQQNFLSKQSANGGGDFEEAVDQALTEAIDKQWSTNSTKLLFHVADAPAHDKDAEKWAKATYEAARKGIKIISIAASGIDKKTEYFFRSQSILTSGQYVFLTDDSGIGNAHEKPTIKEELVVEYLNNCLIRLIDGYHKGVFAEPIPYTQANR